MKPFYICLTFDTDPDPNIDQKYIDNIKKNIHGWKGLEIGKNLIDKKITLIEKKLKTNIPSTWFVRVDDQIKYHHKKETWLIKKYNKYWKKVIKNSGSIQWHIHLNKKVNNNWFREFSNDEIKKSLNRNFKSFKKIIKKPRCVRIGEAYLNNKIANHLRKIGIEADSSALPERKREDKNKTFDWSICPNKPYFMSKNNYQKKTNKISKNDLLELPMNTISTKCSYDKKYIKRYYNLSFKSKILEKNLSDYIKNNDYLITMTHPFEIVSFFKNKKNSNLISFSAKEFEKNLVNLILYCKKNNRKAVFLNIENIIDKLKNV